ncbi:hypothetical protein [Asticcacaulis sp. YBE204]|uniref:hypothetical protein n=1 Tax=Asticcacaulis sp. YBE204 TaxID=1282363 RepID=UPI0003C3E981|nr:hypothetical protein [Asticcacaulis sp. YBE204]ESQ79570.1 hypothetical protein AEYBE204_06930 [Asticcacaulis sp. YBE204]
MPDDLITKTPPADTPTSPAPQDFATEPASTEALLIDLEDARHLKKDLEDLLEGVETAHLKAEVKAHISKLNSWAGRYVEGLDAAQQLSETGLDMLEEARAQISLQLDEYLRLEGEGGQVATPEQNRLIDELSRALRRIDRLSKAMASTIETQLTDKS